MSILKTISVVTVGATVVALGVVGTEQAMALTLTFDEFADETILPPGSFDALGVRFNQNLRVDDGNVGGLAQSLPNYVFNNDNFANDITGFFLGPVPSANFISVFAGDAGLGDIDTVILRGFNASNTLVASSSYSGAAAGTVSISGPEITRFEIDQTSLSALMILLSMPLQSPLNSPQD